MKKRNLHLVSWISGGLVPIAFSIFVINGFTRCAGTASPSPSPSASPSASTVPTLTSSDLNTLTPCPNQTLLTSSTFLADIKAATAMSLVFDSSNSYTTICGLGSNFTGVGSTALVTFQNYDPNNLVTVGVGVCGTTLGISTPSFPVAGVYRKDMQFSANGRNYRVRMRTTITAGSPDVTGKTFSSVLGSSNIDSTIQYLDPTGAVIAQNVALYNSFVSNLPSATYTLKSVASGNVLMTAKIEMVCAVGL